MDKPPPTFRRLGALDSVDEFRAHLHVLGLELPVDPRPLSAAEGSPLAQPCQIGSFTVGNRWAVHPMEGWDGTPDGRPTEHTLRRWRNFGLSGCKLIWGGEACAVTHAGRANPRQLYSRPDNLEPLRQLRQTLVAAHREAFGPAGDADLLVGLQLTHSGRFCRPNPQNRLEPRIAYHHPLLDARFGIDPHDDAVVLSDGEIRQLVDDYVVAARLAQQAGFQFVDVKQCHGYLGHEFLSAFTRPGPYGGDFEGRTRFLREILTALRAECPGLMLGVRLSLFDDVPYRPDPALTGHGKYGPGIPEIPPAGDYPAFGCRRDNPHEIDLTEPIRLLRMLRDDFGVELFNLSAGSPYYNPHLQRPALYPPSDGYQPPEDPLVGCVRQLVAVRHAKQALPDLPIVGTAYSYLQEFLPHVAQALVREGWVDFVGLGRLILSYWDLPADVLAGREIRTKRICRTFSDSTTAPRNGLISGCFPLDDYYKARPEFAELKLAKADLRKRLQ